MRKATENRSDPTDAAAHVEDLNRVAEEAERAGDAELARMLRTQAMMTERRPDAFAGAVTLVRRDGTQLRLRDAQAAIRRNGVQTRGRSAAADAAYVAEVLRKMDAIIAQDSKPKARGGSSLAADMRRLSADCKALSSIAGQVRISNAIDAAYRPAPKRESFDDDWDDEDDPIYVED